MLARMHLPEMRRDELTRALSEIHLPEIDLRETVSKIELPKLEMPSVELPKVDLPHLDVRKVMADAGEAMGFERPAERPRWLLAGGLIVAAVAGGFVAGRAILRDKASRESLARAWHDVRERISYAVGSLGRRLRGERTELIALDVATPAPEEMAPAPTGMAPAAAAVATEELVFVESGEPC